MKIGIVGSEKAKFTELGEARAKDAIRDILRSGGADTVISGHCHLGGVDLWAEEVADELGIGKQIFPPAYLNWSQGYKPRNLQIAHNSDIVYCITVDKLPPGYSGMVFPYCYHCLKAGRDARDHVKSGGCWTVIQGMKLGKEGRWIVINNA
jgi:hypothetical protein